MKKNFYTQAKIFKSKISSLGGTFFEFYEFTLYGVFSPFFAILFFPNNHFLSSLSYSLLIFALGSLARPFGGILFGYIGDYFGRKQALCSSILMMAIPTFIIGILPTYKNIGIYAPLILIFCRIFQGLSAGGEFNGASIYIIEHSNAKLRGLNGSLTVAISAMGTLIAMLLGSVSVSCEDCLFSWRVLFIAGALGGIGIFMLRKLMIETPVFKEELEVNKNFDKKFFKLIQKHYPILLGVIGIGCFGSVSGFTLLTYVNIYLSQIIKIDVSLSMFLSVFGIFFFIVFNPIMGYLSDKISLFKIMACSCILTISLSLIIYRFLSSGLIANIIFAELMLAVCASLFTGPMNYFLVNLFPIRIRYRFISFGYSLGIALFGGTMPLICTFLIEKTGAIMMPSLYLIFSAVIGFASIASLQMYKNKQKTTTDSLS